MVLKYRRRVARKFKRKAKKVSLDRQLMKQAGKINNRLIIKHGLASQGLETANIRDTVQLCGPTFIPSLYTGGPLAIGSGVTVPSIFNASNGAVEFGAVCSFRGADLSRQTQVWINWDQFKLVKV